MEDSAAYMAHFTWELNPSCTTCVNDGFPAQCAPQPLLMHRHMQVAILSSISTKHASIGGANESDMHRDRLCSPDMPLQGP
eukprot:scaffold296243_cov33-Prasinocladus_malaysianus.AAC.1